jgi:Ca2+-binding EF-hand superfamily protein
MRLFVSALILSFIVSPVVAGGHLESERSGKKDRFAAADSNGDNKISRAEFFAMAEKRFAKMDKNGDGILSKDEMRRRKHKGHGDH